MRGGFLLAAAALALAAPVRPDAVDARREDLRRLRSEISRKSREKRQAERRAKELEQEVSRVSKELSSSRRSLKEVEKRIRDTERKRSDAENRLWASRLDLRQWNRTLSEDLRRLYERRTAAEAARFVELSWRRSLVREKAAAVSAARALHAENRAAHDELAALKGEFESLRDRREKEAERVREAKVRMTQMLGGVTSRRAVLENELGELQASARRMESLVQDLMREREAREAAAARASAKPAAKAPKGPRGRRGRRRQAAAPPPDFGKLPWPVEGAVVARFGKFKHPELDTVVVSNGIKIRPAAGAAVRAVGKGEVLYAGEFMGYGLMALVAHPDNLFTIYAHLGDLAVKKGQRVSTGENLGRAGVDEDDRPTAYFELRLHGEAMDPLLWLK